MHPPQVHWFQNCKRWHPNADYTIGKLLGSGSFSVVRECTRKDTQEKYALKAIKKKSVKEFYFLENEIKILQSMSHPNIIKLIEVYETDEELFLVMEFIGGGELYEFLINSGPFSEDKTFQIFHQVVSAVTYLHKNGIVHRDIKLENVLWTDTINELKLTDFGLSKNIMLSDVEFMSTPCGTPSYVAPEIIRGEQYTPAVDVWALGVVLYVLLFCKYPFTGDSLGEIYQQIETGRISFPPEIEISEDVKDLVFSLLKDDVKSRLSLEQVNSHPWMQKNLSKSG